MLKVYLFNAPPRAGKGISASCLSSHIIDKGEIACVREFKDQLIMITAAGLGIPVEQFLDGYDEKTYDYLNRKGYYVSTKVELSTEWWKDMPLYRINNKLYSKRQALIHFSEVVIKPSFGEDAFGKALVAALPKEGAVCIADGGFPEELQPVIDYVGAENVTVVRIFRNGCSFVNDSRDYLEPAMLKGKVKFLNINNDDSIEDYESKLIKLYEEGKL